jgi:hypothetical protein
MEAKKPNALRNATDTKALNPNEMAISQLAGFFCLQG